MIYLTTGANGAGKTLLTLKNVREQQLKENRPVYFNGFEMDEAKQAEFGWQKFDPKKWQDLPDGSICIMDECQNEFPVRGGNAPVPDYINAIAQFRRKRGFDFWMTTPHPMLMDLFIRRLVDTPSWHRHLKRAPAGSLVSVIKYKAVKTDCEKMGSSASGEVSMVAFPKEVYEWYRSASLHTARPHIPKQVYVIAVCVLVVPVLAYLAYDRIAHPKSAALDSVKAAVGPVPGQVPGARPGVGRRDRAPVQALADYVADHTPVVPGMAWTAPAYSALLAPVVAPIPAACVHGVKAGKPFCNCYTQQATRLVVSNDLCVQIAEQGFFMEWEAGGSRSARSPEGRSLQASPGTPAAPGAAASPAAASRPSAAASAAAGFAFSPHDAYQAGFVDVGTTAAERDGSMLASMRPAAPAAPKFISRAY
jgi:zona occludens toxin